MPPRSVCLNVFTTSLGNGSVNKEAEVMVREAEERHGTAKERKRHDSLQEDSISTTSFASKPIPSTFSSATIDVTAFPADIRDSADPFFSSTLPTTCSTCTRPPPSGHSLLRCSRCKRTYYCSRTCQKQAWKGHKADCDPVTARSPSSALDTPDVSVPGSPAMTTDEEQFNLAASITCDAIHDASYQTAAN